MRPWSGREWNIGADRMLSLQIEYSSLPMLAAAANLFYLRCAQKIADFQGEF